MNRTNFKTIKFTLTALILIFTAGIFTSCYTPNPLYGTWSDNDGNTIMFSDDGTFSAKIMNSANELIDYQGDYQVVDNTLVFNITGDKSYSRVTEWDIRGSMLFLTWTANNNTKNITLYHIAR